MKRQYIVRWYATRSQIVTAKSEEAAEALAESRPDAWQGPDEEIEAEEYEG